MNLRMLLVPLPLLILAGCSSSHDASKGGDQPPVTTQAPASQSGGQQPAGERVDTVTADKQNTPRPAYDAGTTPVAPSAAGLPSGNYSVQIGAYKESANADRIVSLTKERFPNTVYMFQDKTDNLFKVMIGDFATVEEGRKFRDDMAKAFPAEYQDAWVWRNRQK